MAESGTDSDPTQGPDVSDTGAASPRDAGTWVAGALIAAAAAVAFAFALFGPVVVTVDGARAWVARGTTSLDLLARGLLQGERGDLVSVDGRILVRHAGGPPAIRIDGVPAAADAPIPGGSDIRSFHGRDVRESTVMRFIETPPGVRFAGRGPVESVEDSGTPGIVIADVGIVSRLEVRRRVATRGSPMTVRREPAWTGRKEVALTFDDGPWPKSTDQVLALLKAADVKATFFMIGRQVTARPDTARRVLAAGMEIGNHTQNHKLLAHASHAVVTHEIERGRRSIEKVLHVQIRWYRPAGGSTNGFVYREAKRLGMRVVLWSIDPKDWARPGSRKIARRILDRVRPGSVILMHDGGGNRSQTVAALKKVLKGLHARGYKMVTLSRLYRLPAQVAIP